MALSDTNIKMQEVDKLVNNKSTSTNVKLRELCSSSNINPWSKMKPKDITKTMGDGYGIRLLSNLPEEGSTTYKTLTDLWDAVKNNGLKGYELTNRVTGTSTNIRLGDFRNYDNTNTPPIANLYKTGDEINLSSLPNIANKQYEKDVEANDRTSTSPTLIGRDELVANYSVLNRGVLFIKYNGGESYTPECWCVSSIPNGYATTYYNENGEVHNVLLEEWQLVNSGDSVAVSNYYVMEFMTNAPENTFSNDPSVNSHTFIALPYAAHAVKVNAPLIIIFYPTVKNNRERFEIGSNKFEYSFSFSNNNSAIESNNMNISDVKIKLYRNQFENPLYETTSNDFTIKNNEVVPPINGTLNLPNGQTFEDDLYFFKVSYMINDVYYDIKTFNISSSTNEGIDIIKIDIAKVSISNTLNINKVNYEFTISATATPADNVNINVTNVLIEMGSNLTAPLDSCTLTSQNNYKQTYTGSFNMPATEAIPVALVVKCQAKLSSEDLYKDYNASYTIPDHEINP